MITSFILRVLLSRFADTNQHHLCQVLILEEGEDLVHPGPVQHFKGYHTTTCIILCWNSRICG